ncbi:hypothetical protein SBD_0213 [Streptomyces bottropensis ATCC 25435]|uniref:Uncharacterized protein n=1 Tax=Streptomyces bottropensis ATCC 25435 TaxID=1054862 RepID=M3EM60_9ACTN|nr:hypothetical protein SBD_0213 [Streptomyces bottropensis ATCC 25435]
MRRAEAGAAASGAVRLAAGDDEAAPGHEGPARSPQVPAISMMTS